MQICVAWFPQSHWLAILAISCFEGWQLAWKTKAHTQLCKLRRIILYSITACQSVSVTEVRKNDLANTGAYSLNMTLHKRRIRYVRRKLGSNW